MKKKPKKALYWAPRILAILFIIFVSLFALDVFAEGYGFLETIVALFMHLVPTYLLIIALLVAWKHEHIGGIIFIILGIFYIIMAWSNLTFIIFLILPGFLFLIGILFLLNKYLKQ